MGTNETTLHKLSSVIGAVDESVTGAVSWVDRYSDWLAWGAVAVAVLLIFSCFICPACKCVLCMYTYGSRLLCCCRRSPRYTRQNDSEC